jgi:hypothetical protein
MGSIRKVMVTTIAAFIALQSGAAFAQGHKARKTETAVVTAPAVAPAESRALTAFKLGAFIDAQGLLTNRKDYQTRGFTLNDAAIYITKDFSSDLAALVDLPFASQAGSHTNDVAFAQNKAQAYFLFNHDDWTANFGQFDSPFGIEQNDSKDRFFADAGAIKTYMIPVTHTGLMGGYKFGPVTVRGIFANPNNEGTMADTNPAAGAIVRYVSTDSNISVQGGMLLNEQNVPSSDKTNLLIEAALSMKFNAFKLDASYDHKKTAGTDKGANGFGILGTYEAGSPWSFGGRFEILTDVAETNGAGVTMVDKSITTISAGPSYKLTPEVTIRGDGSIGVFDYNAPVEDVTVMGLSISVLATL